MSEQESSPIFSSQEAAQKFVQFIMVQAQNILFVLGKIPGPDGTAPSPNLEAAKMLIDQLEVIQVKTKGNLSEQEARILSDTLQEIRLSFVEASGGTPASMMPDRGPHIDLDQAAGPKPEPKSPPAPPAAPPSATTSNPDNQDDDNDKKRFVKSYG